MDRRVLVAGESHEADLALALGLLERLHGPALGEVPIGIVLVDDLVDLPEVEMVGAEALERLVELAHGHVLAAAMRAELGHEEHGVAAAAGEPLAHELLALAVVVFPGVVHECDAGVDGLLHEANGRAAAARAGQVVSAEPLCWMTNQRACVAPAQIGSSRMAMIAGTMAGRLRTSGL